MCVVGLWDCSTACVLNYEYLTGVPTSSRPLLCVLSEEWTKIDDVPEVYCSHFVIDVAHLNFKTGLSKLVRLLKLHFYLVHI